MSMTRLLPGDPGSVGPYTLLSRLGSGVTGRLYLGESPDGRVVVRVLRARFTTDDELRLRLVHELIPAREVRGPFLARLAAARLSVEASWIAWEYLPGPSLATVMSHREAMPMSQVAALAAGLGAAVRALHDAGVLHGDLHPGNVFVVNGMPRLTGFGTGTAMAAALAGVRPSPAACEFLAPEVAAGGPPSMAGDMFSLAAVLARAAGGTGPFAMGGGESSWVNLGVLPPELRPLITRCLDQDPGSRPTAPEFRSVVAAAHPGLLSADVVSGEVPGPITWPDEDPDTVVEATVGASTVEASTAGASTVPVTAAPMSAAPMSAAVANAAPASAVTPASAAASLTTAVPKRTAAPMTTAVPPGSGGLTKRQARWAAGLCVGITALVVLIGLGATTSGSAGSGPQGPVPGAEQLYLTEYQPGDCLYGTVSTDPSVPWPDPVWLVPCTQRHAFEVFYANSNFWPANAAYPDESGLTAQSDAQCDSAFRDYVGVDPSNSVYSYIALEPVTSDNWAYGDRDLECVAYQAQPPTSQSQPMITGSIKGTGK